jgi:hypothetical protein
MATKQYYQYALTLDTPFWPRKLADELSFTGLHGHLLAVTDLQNDGHIYGDTYRVAGRDRRPAPKAWLASANGGVA